MTYSIDFRKKVLSIKKTQGMSYAVASKFFGLSKTTLLKWKKNPYPEEGRNKPATKINMAALAKDVEENPDSYAYERAKRLSCSKNGLWYALKRLGVTYKKKPQTSKSERRREAYLSKENKKLSRCK